MQNEFLNTQPPYLHIILAEDELFSRWAYKVALQQQALVVRRLRGNKMKSRVSLFDEFSAALQFPYYFGENWDALEECLGDLNWCPADGYVLFISTAVETLTSELGNQFDVFIQVLSNVSRQWASTSEESQPKPFHTYFQCDERNLERFQMLVQKPGGSVSISRITD